MCEKFIFGSGCEVEQCRRPAKKRIFSFVFYLFFLIYFSMKPLKFKRTKTKNKVDFYFDEKKKKGYLFSHPF